MDGNAKNTLASHGRTTTALVRARNAQITTAHTGRGEQPAALDRSGLDVVIASTRDAEWDH
jgi:hypothetical protein